MSKIKSYIWTVIAVIVALCCFGLVACANGDPGTEGGSDAEYTVTWTVGEHATVTATGYDTLPTKLKTGTVVTFSVSMDDGWELVAVGPTNNVTEQTDGSYKFTVSNNIEIRVVTQEDSSELPPITNPCIIGWAIGPNVTVDVIGYDEPPLTVQKGTVIKFNVTPDEGYVVSVKPEETVAKQSDGTYIFEVTETGMSIMITATPESVEEQSLLMWTVDEHVTVNADGYDELPLIVDLGTTVNFTATPDDGYNVVVSENVTKNDDGTYSIVASNAVMQIEISAEAEEKEPLLFDLANVCFSGTSETVNETIDDVTREVYIRPFRMMGGFVDDGQSAYIKLVEVKSRKTFVGETVTRDADSASFELKFDYRDLLEDYGDIEYGEYVDFELYICVTDSEGEEHTTRIDTTDYEIDGRLVFTSYKMVEYTRRNVKYTIDYYSAYNEDPDNTKVFLALTAARSNNYSFSNAQLVVREEDGVNVPYLDISGRFYASYKYDEAMEALNSFVADICPFNEWSNGRPFTQSAVITSNSFSFTVSIDLSKLTGDKTYVMHATMHESQSAQDEGNLIFSSTHFGETVTCGYRHYTLVSYNTGWGWNWPGIEVTQDEDPNKTLEITGTVIKIESGKPYFTVTYAYDGYTQEEIEALPVNFDLQCNNDINGGGWDRNFFDDKISFVIDEENGTFDVRIDISSLRALHGYTVHYSLDKDEGERQNGINNPADYKPNLNGLDGASFVCGDLTYTFVYKKGSGNGNEYWGCLGVVISNTPGYSFVENKTVQLAAESDKMYVVITGTYEGYTLDDLKALITVDYQAPDSGWVTTKFTADQLIVTVDAEAKTFTVKVDITSIANGQYLLHFNGDDIGNENGIAAITCGSKKYSYEFRNFGDWTRYVLTIADAE